MPHRKHPSVRGLQRAETLARVCIVRQWPFFFPVGGHTAQYAPNSYRVRTSAIRMSIAVDRCAYISNSVVSIPRFARFLGDVPADLSNRPLLDRHQIARHLRKFGGPDPHLAISPSWLFYLPPPFACVAVVLVFLVAVFPPGPCRGIRYIHLVGMWSIPHSSDASWRIARIRTASPHRRCQ